MAYKRVVLDGDMSMMVSLDGDMQLDLTPVNGEFGVFTVTKEMVYPFYRGETEVIPSFESQTLETKNKTLATDIEVHPIQVSVTSNLSGGNTVYIGGEIQYG